MSRDVWRHDAQVCWSLLGAIAAAFNCKALKVVINQARPEGARKADPGMPSSHAQSLGFLSGYAACGLLTLGWPAPWPAAAAGSTLACGAFLSWLRVELGFHTTPQVLVGHSLGALSAAAWWRLGQGWALQA
ncbi:unnamed protein product, partial [Prorocentrum cordatum]